MENKSPSHSRFMINKKGSEEEKINMVSKKDLSLSLETGKMKKMNASPRTLLLLANIMINLEQR